MSQIIAVENFCCQIRIENLGWLMGYCSWEAGKKKLPTSGCKVWRDLEKFNAYRITGFLAEESSLVTFSVLFCVELCAVLLRKSNFCRCFADVWNSSRLVTEHVFNLFWIWIWKLQKITWTSIEVHVRVINQNSLICVQTLIRAVAKIPVCSSFVFVLQFWPGKRVDSCHVVWSCGRIQHGSGHHRNRVGTLPTTLTRKSWLSIKAESITWHCHVTM